MIFTCIYGIFVYGLSSEEYVYGFLFQPILNSNFTAKPQRRETRLFFIPRNMDMIKFLKPSITTET